MSRPLRRAALLLLTLLPLSAAEAAPLTYVFATVDRYVVDPLSAKAQVTGLLVGETTPRTIVITGYSSDTDVQNRFMRCERLALLAMNSPGRFRFELGGLYGESLTCALTRNAP